MRSSRNCGRSLKSHAIHDRDEHAVGDGMPALDRLPCVELRRAEFRFLRRMPADARGIKNHLRAAQRHRARAFRIPLVPANLHADASVLRVERRKSQVAGREIEFLVVKRIVRNMHLAVFAEKRRRRRQSPRRYCGKAPPRGARKATRRSRLCFRARLSSAHRWSAPGKLSARLKSSAFSVRQKYSPWNSSSMQTICAPRFAASRIFSIARARLSSAFFVERICIRPTVNLSCIATSYHARIVPVIAFVETRHPAVGVVGA